MDLHLVIGASGQVGEHLLRCLQQQGYRVQGTYHRHPLPGGQPLDIRQGAAVLELARRLRPAVIYLPAGWTHVDGCEQDPERSYAVNVQGTAHVVRAANAVGARLVFFSSDYVFDGAAGPYGEMDLPRPLSVYGWHKLLAEHDIALHAEAALIVRTTVVYGWERQGKNFVQRLLQDLQQGRTLRVPQDQVGSPTYGPNLAAAVLELAGAGAGGLFHVAGPALASRYAFALEAARAFGLDGALIQPVDTAALGQAAARPLQAGLRIDRARSQLRTPLLDYRQGLARMAADGQGAGA
ncbi:MAG: NAD(P)-dependent oxidoreductase [Chloroflexia bacterium]|nr:NAD(P)-dependent oxidoreductase [Chloroflexia bacterium]